MAIVKRSYPLAGLPITKDENGVFMLDGIPLADCVGGTFDDYTPHYFNCKRCGAVGQKDKCEYCGSSDD